MNMKHFFALALLHSSIVLANDGLLDAPATVYSPEKIDAQINGLRGSTEQALKTADAKAGSAATGTNLGALPSGAAPKAPMQRVIPRQEGSLTPATVVPAQGDRSSGTITDRLGKIASGEVTTSGEVVTNEVRQKRETVSSVLPGLEAGRPIKPLILKVQPGVTEVVKIARGFPSLIMTPFAEPQVVDGGKVKLVYAGSNVYVMPLGAEPEALFISDKGKSSVVVSLMVVPEDLPAQQITVQLDGFKGADAQGLADQRERKDDYVSELVDIMREVGQGTVPAGYTASTINEIEARIGSLYALPIQKFSGTDRNIFAYKLSNRGATPITVSEPSFYAKGVRAVALFPKIHLMPGEQTTLYIMSDKTNQEAYK